MDTALCKLDASKPRCIDSYCSMVDLRGSEGTSCGIVRSPVAVAKVTAKQGTATVAQRDNYVNSRTTQMSNWSAFGRAPEHQEAARPRQTKWNERLAKRTGRLSRFAETGSSRSSENFAAHYEVALQL